MINKINKSWGNIMFKKNLTELRGYYTAPYTCTRVK